MPDNIAQFGLTLDDCVFSALGCPKCEEVQTVQLVWNADKQGLVTCMTCGMIYDPAVTDEIWEEST